jgi:thiosulfate sulfurtransferase
MKNTSSGFRRISVEEAKSLIDNEPHITIADIRDDESFYNNNIRDSVHVTSESIENFLKSTNKENPLLIYCYHGVNSQSAAEYFVKEGFKHVFSMDGGFSEYEKSIHHTGDN